MNQDYVKRVFSEELFCFSILCYSTCIDWLKGKGSQRIPVASAVARLTVSALIVNKLGDVLISLLKTLRRTIRAFSRDISTAMLIMIHYVKFKNVINY
jgi:hypothetical protein